MVQMMNNSNIDWIIFISFLLLEIISLIVLHKYEYRMPSWLFLAWYWCFIFISIVVLCYFASKISIHPA